MRILNKKETKNIPTAVPFYTIAKTNPTKRGLSHCFTEN